MATATTNAQYNRNAEQSELIGFGNFLNLFIGIVEAIGWSTFGVLWFEKLALVIWAFAMVYGRFHLLRVKVIALRQGRNGLATLTTNLVRLSVVITFISVFATWAEIQQSYEKHARLNSAPVRVAQLKYETLQEQKQAIEANYSISELSTAKAMQQQLMGQLTVFWSKKHHTGLKYDQIMDGNGNPKPSPYGGGLLKTAARKINQEYQTLQNQFLVNKPLIEAALQLDDITPKLNAAQTALVQAQELTGIDEVDNISIYPPAFVRLSQLTFHSVSPQAWSNLLPLFGIILILVMSVVISEGIVIAPEPAIRTKTTPTPSLFQKLRAKIIAKIEEKLK